MTDTNELRRLAQRATPGPWEAEGQGGIQMDGTRDAYVIYSEGVRSIASVRLISDRQARGNTAAYIAAANPATVLELLDELDRLRIEVARLKGAEMGLQPLKWCSECSHLESEHQEHQAPYTDEPTGRFWCSVKDCLCLSRSVIFTSEIHPEKLS